MKKILILLSFISLQGMAQKNWIGLQLGGGVSNVYPGKISATNFQNRKVGQLGIIFDHLVTPHFCIGADLLYSQQGFSILEQEENSAGQLTDIKIDYHSSYISVPLKLGFRAGRKLYGFGNVEARLSYLLLANAQEPLYDNNNVNIGKAKINNRKYYNSFDFGGIIELGSGYRVSHNYTVMISAMLHHGLLSFIKNGSLEHTSAVIVLGVQHILPKGKSKKTHN